MFQELRASLALLILFTLLTGVGYPLFIMTLGQTLFPRQASGSLVEWQGKIIGSSLIGQSFSNDKYFHPRPSAASAGYDASNSMGSDLAPSSTNLIKTITERVAELKNGDDARSIPVDLVTSSGSGLDPHISVAAATFQAPRVAEARNIQLSQVEALIEKFTEPRTFGILGENRVNVLAINLNLDRTAAELAWSQTPGKR